MIDSQEWESTVVGVSPSGANAFKSSGEIRPKKAVDGVICGGIKVTRNDRWETMGGALLS